MATRMATPDMTTADIDFLRQANRDLAAAMADDDVMRAIAADDRFHGRFVTCSGNTEVGPALERLMPKVRRL